MLKNSKDEDNSLKIHGIMEMLNLRTSEKHHHAKLLFCLLIKSKV